MAPGATVPPDAGRAFTVTFSWAGVDELLGAVDGELPAFGDDAVGLGEGAERGDAAAVPPGARTVPSVRPTAAIDASSRLPGRTCPARTMDEPLRVPVISTPVLHRPPAKKCTIKPPRDAKPVLAR